MNDAAAQPEGAPSSFKLPTLQSAYLRAPDGLHFCQLDPRIELGLQAAAEPRPGRFEPTDLWQVRVPDLSESMSLMINLKTHHAIPIITANLKNKN